MSRLSTITFVGMLALTVAGCESDNEINAPTVSTAQPVAKAFDNRAIVNQQLPGAIFAAPVLIQPTNGNQRAKQVQKGRQDPFAGLFAQAGLMPTTTIPGTVPQPPRLSVPAGRQTVTGGSGSTRINGARQNSDSNSSRQQLNPNRGNTSSQLSSGQTSSGQTSSGQSIPLPPVVPDSIQPAVPPPPQEPDLASNVAVTGIIQIGNETQAIVLVPNEGTSRYVRVGQRLSNGQVLVKRIEMNEGAEPIVILEQYGIEVARAVGEKPVDSAQTGTSTDGSQVPPPSSNSEESPENTSTDTGSVQQSGDNGTSVPTNTPVQQSGDNGTSVPTNTLVPQSIDNGTSVPTNTPVQQSVDDGTAESINNSPVPQSVDNGTSVPTNTPVQQSVDNDTNAGN